MTEVHNNNEWINAMSEIMSKKYSTTSSTGNVNNVNVPINRSF